MRKQRGFDVRELTDKGLLREVFDLADEASAIHRRSGEIALRLDRVVGAIGERWAPDALDKIEEQERVELEVEFGPCPR